RLPNGALARFGTLRWRHNTPVFFLAYLNEDKEMLTVSQDGSMRVWEVATGKEIRRFGLATGQPAQNTQIQVGGNGAMAMVVPVKVFSSAVVSSDRSTLATSGSQDATIRLWDIAAGKEVRSWKPNPQIYVGGMLFSPDGKSLAVKSNDQTLRL